MALNKEEIRQIIENYNHKNGWGNKSQLPNWIIDKIYETQNELQDSELFDDVYEAIIQEYEDICEFDCEHENAFKESDEYCDGPGMNGEGHFVETEFYHCPVCGKNAPYNVVQTEDGYDEEIGEWK